MSKALNEKEYVRIALVSSMTRCEDFSGVGASGVNDLALFDDNKRLPSANVLFLTEDVCCDPSL